MCPNIEGSSKLGYASTNMGMPVTSMYPNIEDNGHPNIQNDQRTQ